MISRLDKWMEISQSKKSTTTTASAIQSSTEKHQSLSQNSAIENLSSHQDFQNNQTKSDNPLQADSLETNKTASFSGDSQISLSSESDVNHTQGAESKGSQGNMGNMSDQLSGLSLEKKSCSKGDIESSLSRPDENNVNEQKSDFVEPDFPLFPMSKGFCITLRNHLRVYKKTLEKLAVEASASANTTSSEEAAI